MINKTTEIEQLIYTAGGTHQIGKDSGNFGVWSASKGLKDIYIQSDLNDFAKIVRNADKNNYNTKYRNEKRLKANAKPNIFGKYREKDFEYVREISSNKIEILEESTDQNLKNACDYNSDFRNNPENAPYRIGSTTLLDGRLVICRICWVNKIFSDADTRSGNFFEHFYVFPKGIKLEDIDISKIDFQMTLEKKYWGKNAEVAPSTLPTRTYEEIQKTDNIQTLYNLTVESIELYNQIQKFEDNENFKKADELEVNLKEIKQKIKQIASTLNMDDLIDKYTKFQEEIKETIIKEAEAKGISSARISGVWFKDPRYKAAAKIVKSAIATKEKNNAFNI